MSSIGNGRLRRDGRRPSARLWEPPRQGSGHLPHRGRLRPGAGARRGVRPPRRRVGRRAGGLRGPGPDARRRPAGLRRRGHAAFPAPHHRDPMPGGRRPRPGGEAAGRHHPRREAHDRGGGAEWAHPGDGGTGAALAGPAGDAVGDSGGRADRAAAHVLRPTDARAAARPGRGPDEARLHLAAGQDHRRRRDDLRQRRPLRGPIAAPAGARGHRLRLQRQRGRLGLARAGRVLPSGHRRGHRGRPPDLRERRHRRLELVQRLPWSAGGFQRVLRLARLHLQRRRLS